MTRKQLLRAAAFVLLAAMMLSYLTWLLRARGSTMASIYSEPDNSIDVLIVGSSHVNSGIIPAVLWDEYGISVHNVHSWSQPMWISYHYLIEALKTQNPTVVVLDLNGMLYGNSIEPPAAIDEVSRENSFMLDLSWNYLQMIGTVADVGVDLQDPLDYLPLTQYHSRWKVLKQDMFVYDAHNDRSTTKNCVFNTAVHPLSAPNYSHTDARTAPYEGSVRYLEKILALCQAERIQLIFTLLPYEYQSNEPAIFNWLNDYSTQHNIPFYNYCLDGQARVALDWSADFADREHLNIHGALKVTCDLGRILSSGGHPLRRPADLPNADQLDADAQFALQLLAQAENIISEDSVS